MGGIIHKGSVNRLFLPGCVLEGSNDGLSHKYNFSYVSETNDGKGRHDYLLFYDSVGWHGNIRNKWLTLLNGEMG